VRAERVILASKMTEKTGEGPTESKGSLKERRKRACELEKGEEAGGESKCITSTIFSCVRVVQGKGQGNKKNLGERNKPHHALQAIYSCFG